MDNLLVPRTSHPCHKINDEIEETNRPWSFVLSANLSVNVGWRSAKEIQFGEGRWKRESFVNGKEINKASAFSIIVLVLYYTVSLYLGRSCLWLRALPRCLHDSSAATALRLRGVPVTPPPVLVPCLSVPGKDEILQVSRFGAS